MTPLFGLFRTVPIVIVLQVGVREGFWGWGNALIDFNNDRFLDFMMTNGKGVER